MGLFQKAPSTPEELQRSRPLEIPPDQVLEMSEEEWYAKAYRGDGVPQLTVRAVALGSALGFLLAFTNVYVGLKTGWHLGVAITACILSYSIWGFLQRVGLARTQLTILENNCMQSTASAAGYSTGNTMVSAIPALLMLSTATYGPGGRHLPLPVLLAWTLFLAGLGVFVAIPMKRNMINQERLRFPTGTAAAVTLQSLYSAGAEASRKARALMIAGVVGLVTPLFRDLTVFTDRARTTLGVVHDALIPGYVKALDFLPSTQVGATRHQPSDFTVRLDTSFLMVAAGALVGLRVAVYMVVGGLLLAFWVGPAALQESWTNPLGAVVTAATKPSSAWKEIGVWVGAPILVSSGLLSFALQWRTIVRAFRGFGRRGGTGTAASQQAAAVEVPGSWFGAGVAFFGAGVVLVAWRYFEIPLLLGALAVILTFFLALVACRATGESDITPTGAMGKIMQLTYGGLIEKNATANLMAAGITAGAAASSADLLTDLKSGYLLGAHPRRQFIAQFFGIFAGTLATTLCFRILIPDATKIMGDDPEFPATAAYQWKAVADVFVVGFDNLHPLWRDGILWGALAGAAMVLAEKLLPAWKKWLPSATGVGLGFILPFNYPLSMFLGAFGAWAWNRLNQKSADRYVVPVASGIIAGESLMGVAVAALNNFVILR